MFPGGSDQAQLNLCSRRKSREEALTLIMRRSPGLYPAAAGVRLNLLLVQGPLQLKHLSLSGRLIRTFAKAERVRHPQTGRRRVTSDNRKFRAGGVSDAGQSRRPPCCERQFGSRFELRRDLRDKMANRRSVPWDTIPVKLSEDAYD